LAKRSASLIVCCPGGRPSPLGNTRIQPKYRRGTLRLPDLDHSEMAVLNSPG
jgi:hypothetical protein